VTLSGNQVDRRKAEREPQCALPAPAFASACEGMSVLYRIRDPRWSLIVVSGRRVCGRALPSTQGWIVSSVRLNQKEVGTNRTCDFMQLRDDMVIGSVTL